MAHVKFFIVSAVALALTAPASAEWSMFGNFEPNTPYDANWIWADPAAAGEQKIYFNAISGSHYPPASAFGKPYVNPNVGALRTQIEPAGLEYHNAFLGVWQDCNGDGYVGMAETAVREYSAALLSSDAVCPAVSGASATWVAGAHNYNGWVSEFIPILRGANLSNDARVYRDDDARVWGDFDRPDEHPTYKTCALFPWPRGTYHNVGGVLNYVDCRQPILEAWNNGMGTIGDPLGLRFSDANDGRTGTLGRIDIGGDESEQNAAVVTSDCDTTARVHSGDTANQTPLGPSVPVGLRNASVTVYSVDPSLRDISSPTIAGQVNRTAEERLGDCNTSNDFGHDVYGGFGTGLPETDFNGVDPNNKIQSNWNLQPSTTTRGGAVVDVTVAGTRVLQRVDFPVFGGASGMPQDGALGTGGTRWVSDSTWGTKPGPRTVRADIGTGEVELAGAYWLTFYAKVGQVTLDRGFALKSPTTGTYGEWACGGDYSTPRPPSTTQGWNCNAGAWYRNPDGSFPNDPNGILAKPGLVYHVRDVDCYDGSIDELGIGVQPSFYGDAPCP